MRLKNVGDVCIVDFSEISDVLFGEISRSEEKTTTLQRRQVERVVGEMLNSYMSRSMTWAKQFSNFNEEYYARRLPRYSEKHPDIYSPLIEAYDSIADLLGEIISLPTWNVIYIRVSGTAVEMEVGEDYRITEWTKEHAAEYSTNPTGKGW